MTVFHSPPCERKVEPAIVREKEKEVQERLNHRVSLNAT